MIGSTVNPTKASSKGTWPKTNRLNNVRSYSISNISTVSNGQMTISKSLLRKIMTKIMVN